MSLCSSSMVGEVQLLTHEFLPFRGGIGVYVEETATALATLGVPVTVWAPGYGKDQADAFPFAVKRIPMRGKQDWACRVRLGQALRKAYPAGRIPGTVVLAEPGPIRLWMYHQLMRLPQPERLVLILHGSEIQALAKLAHRKRLFRQLLQRADAIGVVSEAVRDLLNAHFPEVSGKLIIVRGAVRAGWQGLPAVSHEADSGLKDLLQVGRIHPRKGQLELLEAVALLPPALRAGIRVRFIGPVGKAGYFAKLQARLCSLGVAFSVEGTVSEAELRKAYETAALTVMPSQPFRTSIEGLGLALLEAQHFGCPVIGTQVGGVAEALRDGQTGLLVPPGNARALAGAIQQLLENPEPASKMGMAGARFVRESFSWERNVRKLGLA